ncbi:MAG TPA: bifunctional DNA-formamidopyrimidine glycosylase/DNA-(apurinic or apyrimidinic site) lyase [Vicinamibacterales bacterium]|nr:bifunctional DNA-formamidopyrimidine glycosylase/DNA-(apurinic or apyrimidinic site) lyase [Vicinamibacterales bacterium]
MPELPEVETVRRLLAPAMQGARFRRVILNRPNLRIPFPEKFADRLRGQTVQRVDRRGKYLIVRVSSGETLIMHLGMSGWFEVVPTGDRSREADPHDHVIFVMSSGRTVVFNDPRRFGFMDLAAADRFDEYPSLRVMGPEPLSAQFNAEALARACRGKKTSLKVALLDQRIVGGLGNIYASEALHHARLSPLRRASTIATAAGKPKPHAHRLAEGVKAVLKAAIRRRESPYGSARFRVYEREGGRCLRTGCGGTIKRITQAGRSTFYCPKCQR